MNRLRGPALAVLGLLASQDGAHGQAPRTLPGAPAMALKHGCCCMRMRASAPPSAPTDLQALQQAFNMLYALDGHMQKSHLRGSGVQALHQDVKMMQQAARTQNATVAQRRDQIIQTLQSALADLQNIIDDAQTPATTRAHLARALPQLQQLANLAATAAAQPPAQLPAQPQRP